MPQIIFLNIYSLFFPYINTTQLTNKVLIRTIARKDFH